MVNLSLYLICHHGHWDDFAKDVEVVRRVSFEKGVPITYFFSGLELDSLVNNRDRIQRQFHGFDIVGAIAGGDRFIDPRHGYDSEHKSELGIMPYNHIPLVHPFEPDIWGEYFEGFVREQVDWSRNIASSHFNKTPVSIHPPDGIYAPAVSNCLRNCGMDSVVVSSETFGNGYDKCRMYWGSDLRHVVRTNDLQLESGDFSDANRFIDAVQSYAWDNDIDFVTVGCDIDEFNGQRNMSGHDGIARLCSVGEAAYGRVNMINVNSNAYWNQHTGHIGDVWGWDDVHAMIQGNGGLDFMDGGRNAELGSVVRKLGERHRERWDVSEAKNHVYRALGAECRNGWCSEALTGHYRGNIDVAKSLLRW